MAMTDEEIKEELDEQSKADLAAGNIKPGDGDRAIQALGPARKYYDENDPFGEYVKGKAENTPEGLAEDFPSKGGAGEGSGGPALDDADLADINDTVYMQTGGKAGIAGAKSKEMQTLRDSHLKSVGDAADGGGTVVGTGMRLADDRSWEKDYKDMLQRRAAARAGRKAAADARQELLDTGRYFDDGRGNIKLKKEFREYQRIGNGGRRTYNETMSDDGSARRYIDMAGRGDLSDDDRSALLDGISSTPGARRARSSGMVFRDPAQQKINDRIMKAIDSLKRTKTTAAENKANLEMIKEREAERKSNLAKGMLSVYDGLVAAYNDLTDEANAGRVEDETVAVGPRQFKKDANGRVTTEMEPQERKPTGRRFKNGYVAKEVIRSVNDNLAQRGNRSFRITGIIARQRNDDVKGDIGNPMFYVSGKRWDEEQNRSVPFGKVMTMEDAYRMGVENGKESGLNEVEAEWNVANGFKDVFGRLKGNRIMSEKGKTEMLKQEGLNRREAEKNATSLAIAQLNDEGRDRRNDANLQQKRDEVVAKLKMDYSKMKSTDAGKAQFALKYIPEAVWKTILAPQPMRDEKTGEIIMDDATGKPIMRPPTYDETMKLLDGVTAWGVKNFGNDKGEGGGTTQAFVDAVATAKGMPPEQAAQAVQGAAQPEAPAQATQTVNYGLRNDGTPTHGQAGGSAQGAQANGDAILNEMQGGKPPAANGGNAATQATKPYAPSNDVLKKRAAIEEQMRAKGIDPAKYAPQNDGSGATQQPSTAKKPSREEAYAAEEQRRLRNGKAMSAQTRQPTLIANEGSETLSDEDIGDIQESVDRSAAGADDVYRTLPPKLMKRLKDATGATDAEIMSGKYDRQIEALGARMGDDSVNGISDRRKAAQRKIDLMKSERKRQGEQDALRMRQEQFSVERKNMEKSARDDAEKYGVAHGYDDRQIEERASRSIRRGLTELREKYGLAADGSQDVAVATKKQVGGEKDGYDINAEMPKIEEAMASQVRRDKAIEQVNEYIADMRKHDSRLRKERADKEANSAKIADARRLKKLFESGDTDKIREEALKDSELAALIDDVFGER